MDVIQNDWWLTEWLLFMGKRQADVVADLGWNPARISLMLRGKQQYTRDALNQLAAYLQLQPYELLMRPEEAMALRRLRELAETIASYATDLPS